jgi:hypothetical protein
VAIRADTLRPVQRRCVKVVLRGGTYSGSRGSESPGILGAPLYRLPNHRCLFTFFPPCAYVANIHDMHMVTLYKYMKASFNNFAMFTGWDLSILPARLLRCGMSLT